MIVQHNDYDTAREIFYIIKKRFLDPKNKTKVFSFYQSICELNSLYDIKIFENRFVIGGTVEYLFTALLNSFGFHTRNEGHMTYGTDISVGLRYKDNDKYNYIESKFSLKYSSGKNDIIISNAIGNKAREWTEPTIFIMRDYKIFYADPALMADVLNDKNITKIKSNNVLPFSAIREFLKKVEDDYYIDYNYRCMIKFLQKRVVSYDVAKGILADKVLKRHLNTPYQPEVAQIFPEYFEEESPLEIEVKKSLRQYYPVFYPFSL